MKKKSILFTLCLLMVTAMMALLCACSSYGGIKSAFSKEGFEEVEVTDDMKKLYESSEDFKKISEVVTLHTLQKKSDSDSVLGNALNALNIVVIAEFKSNDEMEEALKDHVTEKDAKNIYDELQKLDIVNGNCFLLFATSTKSYDIFKGTK